MARQCRLLGDKKSPDNPSGLFECILAELRSGRFILRLFLIRRGAAVVIVFCVAAN